MPKSIFNKKLILFLLAPTIGACQSFSEPISNATSAVSAAQTQCGTSSHAVIATVEKTEQIDALIGANPRGSSSLGYINGTITHWPVTLSVLNLNTGSEEYKDTAYYRPAQSIKIDEDGKVYETVVLEKSRSWFSSANLETFIQTNYWNFTRDHRDYAADYARSIDVFNLQSDGSLQFRSSRSDFHRSENEGLRFSQRTFDADGNSTLKSVSASRSAFDHLLTPGSKQIFCSNSSEIEARTLETIADRLTFAEWLNGWEDIDLGLQTTPIDCAQSCTQLNSTRLTSTISSNEDHCYYYDIERDENNLKTLWAKLKVLEGSSSACQSTLMFSVHRGTRVDDNACNSGPPLSRVLMTNPEQCHEWNAQQFYDKQRDHEYDRVYIRLRQIPFRNQSCTTPYELTTEGLTRNRGCQ